MNKNQKIVLLLGIAAVVGTAYLLGKPAKEKTGASPALPAANPENPQDKIVLDMMAEINANYALLSTPADFQDTMDRLHEESQPIQVQCIMAPCPEQHQVSMDVELAAKALIEKLNADNQIQNGYLWGGTGGR